MNVIRQTAALSEWLNGLQDLEGKGRILARIEHAKLGNFGDCEPVGNGVSEMRVHFGPGYRIYLMREGQIVYLLLCGGDKSTQDKDIKRAKAMAKAVRAAPKLKERKEPQAVKRATKQTKGEAKRASNPRKKG